ncbi:MAG: hypothetical protein ABI388_10710 [Bacteroidia bacterium]
MYESIYFSGIFTLMFSRNIFLFFIFLFCKEIMYAQTKTFHHLSKYEKRWAICHPFAAIKIKKHQTEMYAVVKEVKQQNSLDAFENGGKLDAFRHTFAMAYFSKFVKANKLRKLGKAHEKANYWMFLHNLNEDGELADSLSTVMDLANNNIALSLRKEVKNLSTEEIKQKIITLIKNGGAFIMKRNSQGQYVDCNNVLIPVQKLKIWNTPKCLVKSNYVN